jgi:hypothetical protein
MAPQRRHNEADEAIERKAWSMAFKSGYDYLGALPQIGVAISKRHQPAREIMEDAWRWLGRAYLDDRDPELPLSWAERELGQPEDMPLPAPRRRASAKPKPR